MIPSSYFRKNDNFLLLPDSRPTQSQTSKRLISPALRTENDRKRRRLDPWGYISTRKRIFLHRVVANQLQERDSIDWNAVSICLGSLDPVNCYLQYKIGSKQGIASHLLMDSGCVNESFETITSWTDEELSILREQAERFKCFNWVKISLSLPGRSPIECLKRYQQLINDNFDFVPWTEAEEDRMIKAIHHSVNSKALLGLFPGRPVSQISRLYWKYKSKPSRVEGKWVGEQERKLILALISLRGKDDGDQHAHEDMDEANNVIDAEKKSRMSIGFWNLVSEFVPGKDNAQCRSKWSTSNLCQINIPSENQTQKIGDDDGKLNSHWCIFIFNCDVFVMCSDLNKTYQSDSDSSFS